MGLFAKYAEKKRLQEEQKQREQELREKELSKIRDEGILPEVSGTALLLQKGETCHYSGNAVRLITKEKTVGFTAKNAGASFRVARGVTLRTGGAKGVPVRQDVTDRFPGTLFLTNKRIIFQADKNGFVLPLIKLVSIKQYTDGCEYFKDSVAYLLRLNDSEYCNLVLSVILDKREVE